MTRALPQGNPKAPIDRVALRVHFARRSDSLAAWCRRKALRYRTVRAAISGERRSERAAQIVRLLTVELRRQ